MRITYLCNCIWNASVALGDTRVHLCHTHVTCAALPGSAVLTSFRNIYTNTSDQMWFLHFKIYAFIDLPKTWRIN